MDGKTHIYICDDNEGFFDELKSCINSIMLKSNKDYEITEFKSGAELIEAYSHQRCDAIFLDIDMPVMNGHETALKLQEINHDVLIVFITTHDELVYNSWLYQPYWFVRKSHMDDLETVIPRLLIKINSIHEKENPIFKLVCENRMESIDVNQVKYIESHRHYIFVKNMDGSEKQYRCKISEAESQLNHMWFVRIQNGILANCRNIYRITSRDVIFTDGEKIHLNRERADAVKKAYLDYTRRR